MNFFGYEVLTENFNTGRLSLTACYLANSDLVFMGTLI